MTDRPGIGSTRKVQSLHKWESIFQEIEQNEICGLNLTTTGPDPLSHEIRLISLAFPNGSVYIVDCLELLEVGEIIISDLARAPG